MLPPPTGYRGERPLWSPVLLHTRGASEVMKHNAEPGITPAELRGRVEGTNRGHKACLFPPGVASAAPVRCRSGGQPHTAAVPRHRI